MSVVKIPVENIKDVNEAREALQHGQEKRNWDVINIAAARKLLLTKELINKLNHLYDGKYHLTSFSANRSGKEPGKWHTDHPYYQGKAPLHLRITDRWAKTDALSYQCNITLDDFTEENGATEYKEHGMVTKMLAPKGTIVMYRGDLWHRSGANQTDEKRIALLANFAPLCVEPLEIHNAPQLAELIKPDDPDFLVRDGKVRPVFAHCDECNKRCLWEDGDGNNMGTFCYDCCGNDEDYARIKLKRVLEERQK